ncbi:MAG: Mur ligase family protein [Trueperaceae bacterium]|nr:Mur ligase family protein [Trueperaceae bacterium]
MTARRRPGRAADRSHGEVQAALDRLYARTRRGAPRDPARTRRLLDRLGVPDPAAVVHVVGTNGKGSVAARIAAGLQAAGATPLRYLSPHVERFHERIEVAGEPLRDDELLSFLARAWRDEPDPPAAFFELATAMALDVAHRRGADWAVLEAGVGAARDATLAISNVRATVITNVAEDHLDQLGPDLVDVARDKAEAIRPGVPVVTGATGTPLAVVRTVAARRGSPLHVLSDGGPAFDRPEGAPAASAGTRDVGARLALATLRSLRLGPEPERRALRAAVDDPRLPARRERFMLDRGRSVLLDGAHNPSAALALAAEAPAGAHLLLGVARRKDAERIRAVFAHAPRTTLTAAISGERPWGDDPAFVADAEVALAAALDALPPDGTLIVTGSFYLAGRLRSTLRRRSDATRRERAPRYDPIS